MHTLLEYISYLRLNIDDQWFNLQEYIKNNMPHISLNGLYRLQVFDYSHEWKLSIDRGVYVDEFGEWRLYFGYDRNGHLCGVYSTLRK